MDTEQISQELFETVLAEITNEEGRGQPVHFNITDTGVMNQESANGFIILSFPSITKPSCISSDKKIRQFASKADWR